MEIRKKIAFIILILTIIPATFGQSIESELNIVLTDFLRLCDNFSHVELDEYINQLRNFLSQHDKRFEMIRDNGGIYYVNNFMLTAGCDYGVEYKSSAGLGVQYSFFLYENNVLLFTLYEITEKEGQGETIRNSNHEMPKYLISLYPNGTYNNRKYYLYLEEGSIICRVR